MCRGIFIRINDPDQHDIIQFRIAWVVLDKKWANNTDPDQMPRSATSDLGPHCLPMSYKRDAGLYKLRDLDIGYHQSINIYYVKIPCTAPNRFYQCRREM